MSYFVLKNNFKKRGVPPVINAVLAECFNIKHPMPPMSGYSWTCIDKEKRIYPNELYLVSKDRFYNFDYVGFWDGYIISENFKNLLDVYSNFSYKEISLHVIGWKGNVITDKKYFFIEIPNIEWVDAIDYDKSFFCLNEYFIKLKGLDVNEVIAKKDFYMNIKKYTSISLDSKKCNSNNIFKLLDGVIHDLVCDDIFYNKMNELDIYGVDVIDLDNIEHYFDYYRR